MYFKLRNALVRFFNYFRPHLGFPSYLGLLFLLLHFSEIYAQAPTIGASNFSVSNIEGNRLRVNWTRGNGARVLVVASLNSNFNGGGIPQNGIDYNADAAFGSGNEIPVSSGSGNFIVYKGTGTSVTVTNLIHSTTYYFKIFEFNGTNFTTEYNISDVISGQGTTLSPPTIGADNFRATVTGNTAGLKWTRGNGTRSLLIMRKGEKATDPVMYTNYSFSTTFGAGSVVGGGYAVAFSSSDTVYVTNLEPNTKYYTRIIESNGTSAPVYDFANVLVDSFTTESTPTIGAKNASVSNQQGNSLRISFSKGNGTRRLVVMRQDLPVEWTPTDGVDYSESSVFGTGDDLGNNTYVVGEIFTEILNITNLTPATTYHFSVFEFNGSGVNTFYLTDPAKVLIGQGQTLSPPGIQAGSFVFTNNIGHRANISFTAGNGNGRVILVREGNPVSDVPVNLVSYGANADFVAAPTFPSGTSKVVYRGTSNTFLLTNLQPNTTYHFAIFEYNGTTGPVYNQADPGIGSFTTIGAPTIAPQNLSFFNLQGNRFSYSMNSGNGYGRIIIAKKGSPVDVFPTNGISYTDNVQFGAGADLGNGNYVIDNSAQIGGTTNGLITGLDIGAEYHLAVIEYNGSGSQRIYMPPSEVITGSESTVSAPTVQASNLNFTNITANSVTINWTNGDGNARIVLLRQGSPVTDLPQNLTSYNSSRNYSLPVFLGTSRIMYENNGTSVDIINVPPGEYHIAVIEYNGTSFPVYRLNDPLTGVIQIGEAPVIPATNISFSSIDGDRISVNFTKGDGLSRLGILKEGSPVDAFPLNFNAYAADPDYGQGADLGNGNFVVYSGTGTTFSFRSLKPNTEYHLAIVEFNGSGTTALYQSPSIVGRGSQSTVGPPTVQSSSFFANNIISHRMELTWTKGNGQGRIVVAKANSPVDFVPTDLQSPNFDTDFGIAGGVGNGNFVVYAGTSDNFILRNLEPGTTYHIASFEYNGSAGRVYLKEEPTRSSFTAAEQPSVPPKSLSASSINGDRFSISYTLGNGTKRLVVARKGGLVQNIPSNFTTYTGGNFGLGSALGPDTYVMAVTTSNLLSLQGFEPDTPYGIAVFEMDGSTGNERYLTTEYINTIVKTSSPPTISASSLNVNTIGSTSVNLSWTNGNGAGRMVIIRPVQPVTFAPVNLLTHGTPSTNYTSTAGNLTDGHKLIQRGATPTTTITNLTPGTTYHVSIFEFNGSTQPVYSQIPLKGFFTTLPTTGLAIGGFDAITFCPGQQVDVPYFYTGVLSAGNQISVELSDINGSFSSPTILGTQSTTNPQGFVSAILPSALPEGIGYRLRLRATNPASVSSDNGVNLQIATSIQPTFTVIGGVVTSCGSPIQLSTSQPNYLLQWFKDGVPIPMANSSTYWATSSGNYQLRISGASGGCQLLSEPTFLTIFTAADIVVNLESVYCENEVINLADKVTPAGGTFTGPGINSNQFDASLAGIGQHVLTYEYTDQSSGCSYQIDQLINVASIPEPPVIDLNQGNLISCEGNDVILSSTVGFNVLWSNGATSPTIQVSQSGTYSSVIINESGCESASSNQIEVIINPLPQIPVIEVLNNQTMICEGGVTTLTAPGGFAGYLWSTGASTQSIEAGVGNYFVIVTDQNGCTSEQSQAVQITEQVCTINTPPVILSGRLNTTIEGSAVLDLLSIISDVDDNLDLTTLRIVSMPESGASASIDEQGQLILDYAGISFTGVDQLTIEVCDISGSCAQQIIFVEVIGEIIIYNAISPNGDGFNDVLVIEYIQAIPAAAVNKMSIFNRWGDLVFEVENYDNVERVFAGLNNSGKELPAGIYFYKLQFTSGLPTRTGYLSLKR